MLSLSAFDGRPQGMTVALTDSGLGGLLVCAKLERRLGGTADHGPIRLIYVNAWPDAHHGYNDLPDLAARAAIFDRVLAAMTALQPDLLLIACNTLSVVFGSTAYSRAPAVPVRGILDEGTALFSEALAADPAGALVLFGTRTTIGSGEYLRRLSGRGIDPRRVVSEPCHGLAAAIDRDPDSADLPGLIEECVGRVAPRLPAGGTLYAGLSCTHYAYVADIFRASLGRRTGARVTILDPGERLVEGLTSGMGSRLPGAKARPVSIEVLSKVGLPEAQRRAVARRLEPISAITARGLLEYRRHPDLF